jgi:spermidine synthase
MSTGVAQRAAGEPLVTRSQAIVLLGSVFLVAGCGLAYELIMGTAAAFFFGDTVLQFSVTIGIFLASLGLGAALSRRLDGDLLPTFVLVEIGVAVVGGASAALIYAAYGWSMAARGVTVILPVAVGVLVGLEIPVLARLLAPGRALRETFANVLAFDYLGALLASLTYPLLLLPALGVVRSALVFGTLNALVALLTAWTFRHEPRVRRLLPLAVAALGALCAGFAGAGYLVGAVERRLYGGEILADLETPYQRVALTQRGEVLELWLNGHLQFNSRDHARYHESLAHPAMGATSAREHVLIIGGGDGLLVREVLRHPEVGSVTLVDIDPELVTLCRTDARLVALNQGALDDPRVRIHAADGFVWLQESNDRFDRIFLDLPDPRSEGVARLYSVEFFRMATRHLTPQGVVAVQASSPFHTPRVFWSVVTSMEEAGLLPSPAHVNVPSFGEWGFVFGAERRFAYGASSLPAGLAFLTPEVARGLFAWPLDMPRLEVEATHFDRPVVLAYYAADAAAWRAPE